jgi:hypothetical protein
MPPQRATTRRRSAAAATPPSAAPWALTSTACNGAPWTSMLPMYARQGRLALSGDVSRSVGAPSLR